MPFHIYKHSPLYKSQDEHIEILGTAPTKDECIEIFRGYLLACNQRLLDLSETMDVPRCITDLAHINIGRNLHLDIVVDKNGIIYVDGVGPEMDYYTIKQEEIHVK